MLVVAARRIPDKFFYIAAKTLAETVSEEDIAFGALFPNLTMIRMVSHKIALAVAEEAYNLNVATVFPRPHHLETFIENHMYDTEYHPYCYLQGDDEGVELD